MTKFSVMFKVSSLFIVILCFVQLSLAFVVLVDTKDHTQKFRSHVVSTNSNTCAFRSMNANTKHHPVSLSLGQRQSPSRGIARHMFGGLFGGGGDKTKQKSEDGQLALYPNLANGVKFQSLSDYLINKWATLFESGTIKLTTPVSVLPMSKSPGNYDGTVIAVNGVRLVFQNTNTGYKSKKEEQETETGNDDTKKKPEKQVKQGGVEILIELVGAAAGSDDDDESENLQVRVRAQRCDFDEDTIIKEMSEEAILKELRGAIEIWKREASA